MKICTHLCFDGTCEAAFRAYQEILGGTITTMLRYGDTPLAEQTPAHMRSKIIHASLVIGAHELLGVDVMPENRRAPSGYFVTVSIDDPVRAKEVFLALSEGGEVGMPFQSTFWSPGYGVLVDRFGIPWEVNCEQERTPAQRAVAADVSTSASPRQNRG